MNFTVQEEDGTCILVNEMRVPDKKLPGNGCGIMAAAGKVIATTAEAGSTAEPASEEGAQ